MEQPIYCPKLLGTIIRTHRVLKNLNQKQMGKVLKIAQGTISTAEQGYDGTKIGTLLRILDGLDLELVVRSKYLDVTIMHPERMSYGRIPL